jgi:hypothetical protein
MKPFRALQLNTVLLSSISWVAVGCDSAPSTPYQTSSPPTSTAECPGSQGQPCTCDDGRSGTTGCTLHSEDSELYDSTCHCSGLIPSTATCPWPDAGAPCFEPCGGEPVGSWEFDSACFQTVHSDDGSGCAQSIVMTPGTGTIHLDLLDNGVVQGAISVAWSQDSRITPRCLWGYSATVDMCDASLDFYSTTLWFQSPDVTCRGGSGCGRCSCRSDDSMRDEAKYFDSTWSRSDTTLKLPTASLPYCVQGNSMWIGGGTKVAYKLKKVACQGTPVGCSARTQAQCALGTGCRWGTCQATGTGSQSKCAAAVTSDACGVIQGCNWNSTLCVGTAPTTCDTSSCTSPGCAWAPLY